MLAHFFFAFLLVWWCYDYPHEEAAVRFQCTCLFCFCGGSFGTLCLLYLSYGISCICFLRLFSWEALAGRRCPSMILLWGQDSLSFMSDFLRLQSCNSGCLLIRQCNESYVGFGNQHLRDQSSSIRAQSQYPVLRSKTGVCSHGVIVPPLADTCTNSAVGNYLYRARIRREQERPCPPALRFQFRREQQRPCLPQLSLPVPRCVLLSYR